MLKSVLRLAKLFYNVVLPCVVITLVILAVWLLARNLEPVVYDWMSASTVRANNTPYAPVVILTFGDADVQALEAKYGRMPWTEAAYHTFWQDLQQANPTLVIHSGRLMANALPLMRFNAWQNLSPDQQKKVLLGASAYDTSLAMAVKPSVFMKQTLDKTGIYPMVADQEQNILRGFSPLPDMKQRLAKNNGTPDYWEASHLQLHLAVKATLAYLNQRLGLSSPWQAELTRPGGTNEGGLLTLRNQALPGQHLKLPVDNNGFFLNRWYPLTQHGSSRVSHPTFSWMQWQALTPKERRTTADQRMLLLAPDVSTMRNTMHSSVHTHHLQADVLATSISNLLYNQTLVRLPFWQRSLIAFAFFMAALVIRIKFMSFGRAVLYVAVLMVGYFWLTLLAFARHQTLMDVVTPEVFMLMGLLFGTVWWSTNRDKQLQSLEQTMSQLVSPSVYTQIHKNKKLQASGQRLEITSLFVDIREFTSLSENLPAVEVTALLNAFYTEVEATMVEHHGTIDKYMGDGVLVMFGAPIVTPSHADLALTASVQLMQRLATLSQRWYEERHIRFDTGISLNSGHAYVGFVGPSKKLEYTAIGDTVNLCIRLQDQNKRFGVKLILSDNTLRYCQQNDWRGQMSQLGAVKVRGRETTVQIYTLASEWERARHSVGQGHLAPISSPPSNTSQKQ
jgi:class 3 adenylate cyclase